MYFDTGLLHQNQLSRGYSNSRYMNMSVKSIVYSKSSLLSFLSFAKKYYHRLPLKILLLHQECWVIVSYLAFFWSFCWCARCVRSTKWYHLLCFHFSTFLCSEAEVAVLVLYNTVTGLCDTYTYVLSCILYFCNTDLKSHIIYCSTAEQLKLVKYQRWIRTSYHLLL